MSLAQGARAAPASRCRHDWCSDSQALGTICGRARSNTWSATVAPRRVS
jgi:hypothetical protein